MSNQRKAEQFQVMDLFSQGYFSKLEDAVMYHREKVLEDPNKEVQLIQALKPFMPKEKHMQADKMIEAMTFLKTFERMQQDLSNKQQRIHSTNQPRQNSLQQDGVYDWDRMCMEKKENPSDANSMLGYLVNELWKR